MSAITKIADEVEFMLITSEIRSRQDISNYLTSNELNYSIDQVLTEMDRRAVELGEDYPFSSSDGFYSPSISASPSNGYHWLLLISLAKQDTHVENSLILDSIGMKALELYKGNFCKIVNFSFPVRFSESQRPDSFPEAIQWLGNQLGFRTCDYFKIPNRKDGGVDIVVSSKIGNFKALSTTLVQTTTQENYLSKVNDIDIKLWNSWVEFGPDPDRMVLTSKLASPEELNRAHISGTLLLDRVRIVKILNATNLAEVITQVSMLSLFKNGFNL